MILLGSATLQPQNNMAISCPWTEAFALYHRGQGKQAHDQRQGNLTASNRPW